MEHGISTNAELMNIKLLANGNWQVSFELPDTSGELIPQIADLKGDMIQLALVRVQDIINTME